MSQSAWNSERQLYELDEWVTIEDDTYVNAGIWVKAPNQETIERLNHIDNMLLPESALSLVSDFEAEHSRIITIEGTDYYFFRKNRIQEKAE